MASVLEKGLLIALSSLSAIVAITILLPFVGPFLLALLLAALIDQPVNWLEKRGLSRGLATFLLLGALALFAGLSLSVVVLNVTRDIGHLADMLPELRHHFVSVLVRFSQLAADLPSPVHDIVGGSIDPLSRTLALLVGLCFSALGDLPAALSRLVIAVLAAFFLARDGRALARSFVTNLPSSWQRHVAELYRGIFVGMVGFVRAQALIVVLSAVLCTTSLLIFGMPYAWLLGTLAGILDIIPLVGPGALFVPLAAWQWYGGSKATAAGLITSLGLVLMIRQGVEPLLIAGQADLHPLTSLAAVYFGVRLWGLSGLFLGPLLAISVKTLWLSRSH